MVFDDRKLITGQEVVAKITINCDACKYANTTYEAAGTTFLNTILTSTTTGTFPISGGNATLFSSPAYMLINDEIMKITINSNTSITILARGQFGTTAASHTGGQTTQIKHLGEVDGSCYGYAYGCSTGDSYSSSAKLPLIFSSATLPAGTKYFSGLIFEKINYSSPEIIPNETIGTRAKLNFSIIDQRHNDVDTVYYENKRTNNGTFFGKLLARHPYFQGREILYEEGLRDTNTINEPEWIQKKFIIDSFNFDNGEFLVSALDPLILTEGKKSKIPQASPAQLSSAITSVTTTFTYMNAANYYFGASSSTVYVRIDSEIIKCTVSGTTQLTIVTRGYGNTQNKDHSINSSIQSCVRFASIHVIDAIVFVLQNYTNTPATYIDSYATTIALIPTATITEYIISTPTDVVDFINKCIFIGGLIMYFDNSIQKIAIKYINELTISPINIDGDNNIKKNSVKYNSNLKEQYTRFNLSWAPYDITKDTTQTNYLLSLTSINAASELPINLGYANEKKSLMLPMLGNTTNDNLLALSAINRTITNAQVIPEILTFDLDASSIGVTQSSNLTLGSIINVSTYESQDASGLPINKLYQVLKIDGDTFRGFKLKTKRYAAYNPSTIDYTINTGTYLNFVLSSVYAPTIAGNYVIFIDSQTVFGSTNTSTYAFNTGTHAAGVTFTIVNRGKILGMGGSGGNAGAFISGQYNAGSNGNNGGGAFEAYTSCIIDNGAGIIWAGGGGGSGEDSRNFTSAPYTYIGNGGGGGQGYSSSLGGLNGTSSARSESGNISKAGGNGGEWGESGNDFIGIGGTRTGGTSGYAINSHGKTITISSGGSILSIKGLRI